MKEERNALAEALAEIASAAVGGAEATREELAMDAKAAVAEGSDPLPKRTDSWLQYSYGADYGQGKHGRGGGSRAVQSLVDAVSRLRRRGQDALDAERRQKGLARELEAALHGMTAEYNAVEDATMALFDRAVTAQQLCGIVGLAPSKVEKGIVGRLKQVAHILDHVHGAFEEHRDERARMQAQIIELDFYSKLHLKLLEQAKVGATDEQLAVDNAAVFVAPPRKEESRVVAARADAAQVVAAREEEPKEEKPQEEEPRDEEPQEEEPQVDAAQEEEPQDDAAQEEKPQEEEPRDDAAQEDELQEEKPQDDAAQDDAAHDDAAQEEDSQEEKPQEEEPQDDATQDEAAQEEAMQEEKPQEEEAQDDAAQDDAAPEESQDDAAQEEESQDDAAQGS